jgi:hypothetical protein
MPPIITWHILCEILSGAERTQAGSTSAEGQGSDMRAISRAAIQRRLLLAVLLGGSLSGFALGRALSHSWQGAPIHAAVKYRAPVATGRLGTSPVPGAPTRPAPAATPMHNVRTTANHAAASSPTAHPTATPPAARPSNPPDPTSTGNDRSHEHDGRGKDKDKDKDKDKGMATTTTTLAVRARARVMGKATGTTSWGIMATTAVAQRLPPSRDLATATTPAPFSLRLPLPFSLRLPLLRPRRALPTEWHAPHA